MTERRRPRAALLRVALVACALTASARADAPVGRFAVNGGTVFDTVTQLLWQQTASDPPVAFVDASRQCATLLLADKTDWRLPTLQELHTLVDERRADPALDPAFPASQEMNWSDTEDASGIGAHWGMDFATGITVTRVDTDLGSVRCVR
jgi:hypothetical protein